MRAVEMQWRGKKYTIPAAQAFQIGEQVEDIVTLAEIAQWASRPKMHKLARCYATMLRFAGCKVSDAEVKQEIDRSIAKAAAAGVTEDDAKEMFAIRAMQQLIAVLFDGAAGDDAALGPRTILRISDNGPGVPDDQHDQLFAPFQRLGDVPRKDGVGLGLAVARGLTAAMGGTVLTEETPAGGLTFVLDFPRPTEPAQEP